MTDERTGPLPILPPESISATGWLRIYARPIRSAPTYFKRGRMWVLFHTEDALLVAYDQAELKRLVQSYREGVAGTWYEANVLDVEDATGEELIP